MEKPYTHTTWRVRAGSEDEFVRRWSEWVDWSHREGLEAPALLLRDLENPQAHLFACSASRSLENVQCAGSFDSQGLGLEVA